MAQQETLNVAARMPEPEVRERPATEIPGIPMFIAGLVLVLGGAALVIGGAAAGYDGDNATSAVAMTVAGGLLGLVGLIIMFGVTPVAPREARVLQFLGRYTGTVRTQGLRWVNPLTTREKISTRVRNHETTTLKVNDAYGNPIEIAAVVVWQVDDTARAAFEVDDFVEFVSIQTETAVRHVANSYPYDAQEEGKTSLRDSTETITEQLSAEVAARVETAGVTIVESRITHLAYAPEIAQAMLRRQQAGAVVAARQRIVEGAVGMVDLALRKIDEETAVELDEERKAAMVSNLLVVLCGDRDAQPVLNTSSLYQ